MIEEKFKELKASYFRWLHEQDRSSYFVWKDKAEEYFANEMYGYLVDLQRRYNANDEQLGRFVRIVNDFILEQLTINYYYCEFAFIDSLREPQRTLNLSRLLDEMRSDYKIPLLNDTEFNKKNVEVMQLYLNISNARDL